MKTNIKDLILAILVTGHHLSQNMMLPQIHKGHRRMIGLLASKALF
jgi:hypothetical protein